MPNASVFSFFSGLGFLDLGFEESGFEVCFVNEFHEPFLEAYKHARAKMGKALPKYGYALGSIEDHLTDPKLSKRLDGYIQSSRKAGNLVGFIGGPPCPDFSIAGKQRGHHGDNGRLTRVYVELIEKKKPDWFLFENVKGLWGTKKHRLFYDEMKNRLEKSGYTLSDKLVNSAFYGAPQDRARIILIGFKNSSKIEESEWEEEFLFDEDILRKGYWPTTSPFQGKPKKPRGVPEVLTVEHWFKRNKVEAHTNSTHAFTPRAGLARFESVEEGDDKKKSYKRLHRYRYSPTAAYGNNEVHLHPWLPRRISAAEALAIQSLPEEFALPTEMTLSNMFKGIGNGVPFVMARAIATMIKKKL